MVVSGVDKGKHCLCSQCFASFQQLFYDMFFVKIPHVIVVDLHEMDVGFSEFAQNLAYTNIPIRLTKRVWGFASITPKLSSIREKVRPFGLFRQHVYREAFRVQCRCLNYITEQVLKHHGGFASKLSVIKIDQVCDAVHSFNAQVGDLRAFGLAPIFLVHKVDLDSLFNKFDRNVVISSIEYMISLYQKYMPRSNFIRTLKKNKQISWYSQGVPTRFWQQGADDSWPA